MSDPTRIAMKCEEVRPRLDTIGHFIFDKLNMEDPDMVASWIAEYNDLSEKAAHEFVGRDADCGACGEGRLHYLHDAWRRGAETADDWGHVDA